MKKRLMGLMGAQHWQTDMLFFQTLPALGVISQRWPDCHRMELVWRRKTTPGGTPLSSCVLAALFLCTAGSKIWSGSSFWHVKRLFLPDSPPYFHVFFVWLSNSKIRTPKSIGAYKKTAIILSMALSWLIPHQWTAMLSLLSGKEACIVHETRHWVSVCVI